MDILKKYKENGYFTSEIYHLLCKKKVDEASEEIIPSEYEKEMCMTTTERIQSLNNIIIENMVVSGEKRRNVILSFVPRLLIFQNYKANEKIVAKFSVKNISTAPTYLKMVFKESSYFSIKLNRDQPLSRLAPGMNVSFTVMFIPTQVVDYVHSITFSTDMDQYIFPLIAMGPRPIFNFPDQVLLPKVPLKVESNFFLNIRNVGMVPSGLTLNAKCPFSVKPKSAFLNCQENIEIKISFKTMHLGTAQGVLHVTFETGEIFKIKLSGIAHAVELEVEKQAVRMTDTFNGLVRQEILKITNQSDYVLTYFSMKNEHVYYDFKEKIKLATAFYNLKESEAAKCAKLVRYDVLSCAEHERVYTRIFYDEVQALVADEQLYFHNTHFSISPITGKLWPKKTSEIIITFAPKQIGDLETCAFLDIDGVSDRISLKLSGTSLPPAIHLNVETLNIDYVYINKQYNYEIIAINAGHINGEIVYKDAVTLFESKITCTPKCHFIPPGKKETFAISFFNSNPGPFLEEINFLIRDTDVILKLYLKGEVIYPKILFGVSSLDFGNISLGVPKKILLDVINESNVEVKGIVRIPSDGLEMDSLTLADYAVAGYPKPEIAKLPKEFTIEPTKICIGPESAITLSITLTANIITKMRTTLELEFENSDKRQITLPIAYNAIVPSISSVDDIELKACFLDYPYVNKVDITSNDMSGYFTVEKPEISSIDIKIDKTEGFLEPDCTVSLNVTITATVLGAYEFALRLRLFGVAQPYEICHIKGYGVSPIVTCSPLALHWGQLKLLRRSQKTLTLCNDSPVKVKYKTSWLSKDSKWHIEPSEGAIEPESELDLIVSLYLVDAEMYTNKALIHLKNMKDILVPLTVTGVGTSIVVGELGDRIELGHHFTKIPLNYKIFMENRGTRLHALEWSEHYKTPKNKQPTVAFFNLEPRSFKMNASEKVELTITGLSNKVTVVKESWFLVGSIEGVNKKELLLECKITAEFLDPKIELSSTVMDFRYDSGPYNKFYKLTDLLLVKNVSTLPLDLEISTRPPFALVQSQSTYKIDPHDEDLCHCVYLKESEFQQSTVINGNIEPKSEKLVDFLTLKSVQPLHERSLQFFEDINKIKQAFALTYSIEEHLEDQETMKIQVLFDTTKHTSLKARIYMDSMKIKFKGHKNKDCVKVCGKINFPNILVLTPKIDFQCLLNKRVQSKTIKIQNTSLIVCYRFNWKKVQITPLSDQLQQRDVDGTNHFNNQKNITIQQSSLDTTLHASCLSKEKSNIMNASVVSTNFSDPNHPVITGDLKENLMKTVLPMLNENYSKQFKWLYKFPKLISNHEDTINDIFFLIPHRGKLNPNEVQYINVMFQPWNNINVRSTLECQILGGPSEYITISGQSSDLLYLLSSKKINIKIRSFHEIAYESLHLSNKALLPFDFTTYLNEPQFENELYGTILDVAPSEKMLQPEETVDIKILMRPGVLGYFQRVFLIEIGHYPAIPIEVFGWGVISQVYLSIQRPMMSQSDPTLGYIAIGTLTNDYLDVVNLMFNKCTSEHLNSPLTEICFEDPVFQQEWHICSSWDAYPTVMDIEMAVERVLVMDFLRKHPDIIAFHATTTKMKPISGFYTASYIIDFGVVITGCAADCIIEAVNYGPLTTKLHLSKSTAVPEWLNIKLCGKLSPGETGHIDVTFSSDAEHFPDPEQNVEATINLEVPYGVTIPVKFKALCAVPYLATNVTIIDFGSVKCGNKVIISIPIKNIGKPICIWYATLKLKSVGMNQISILDSSGKYEPGESGWISIAFKPTAEITYEGLLIFRFHMNPKRLIIPIVGCGVMPQVHVIGPNISFPPTLPWSETTEHYFGLTNPCPFPIEIIVAHSDIQWKEEEDIFRLLEKYYNKPDEMLIPAIKPGDGLPAEIIEFYKLAKDRVKKCLDEEGAVSKAATMKQTSGKKSKSPRGLSKTSARSQDASPRRNRTEGEILADVFRMMKANNVDPLKDCIQHLDYIPPGLDDDNCSHGLIIIFHGSPGEEEQCQEIAYSVGKTLNIPTINIDFSFVEALCICSTPAQEILIKVIDEIYMVSKAAMEKEDVDIDKMEGEIEELYDTSDAFELLLKKIEVITNNKALTTPKSKASEKKKKKSTTSFVSQAVLEAMGSTTMFNMDLIQELMTEFLSQPKFNRGFVIDSLTSVIFKSPPVALTSILKCKTTISNIHLVLCQSNFNKWALVYEESQREEFLTEENNQKEFADHEIEEIINSVEDMSYKEYDNLGSEFKKIYITRGLEIRRQKYIERTGIIKEVEKREKETKDRSTKSLTGVDGPESKKKLKKDDLKSKTTTEYLIMNTKYNEYYKNVYDNLVNIANNWIPELSDLGYPLIGLNGQIVGPNQKKIKKKSEIRIQSSDESFTERGFPLTLIMCPCINYRDVIVKMFANSPIVTNALKTVEKPDILKYPIESQEYSVLLPKHFPTMNEDESLTWHYLDEPIINKCECNIINNLNIIDDLTQDNVLNILSKWHCTCGKKVISSQTSTMEIPVSSSGRVSTVDSKSDFLNPQPLCKVKSTTHRKERIVLQPGDLVRCKYTFSPKIEGNFHVKRFVEVYGWPASQVMVTVSGICDVPRLDNRPKKMFKDFVRTTNEDNIYKATYLDDQKAFQFGPIFVGTNRLYEEKYVIDLKNSSLIKADIEVEFLHDTEVFRFDRKNLVLEPETRGKLMISAAPVEVGEHTNVLLFCIKNNPDIVTINVACSGVVPVVEVLPTAKIIDYGKHLLYRRKDDRFVVKNDSILPIMWKVRNAQEFLEDFLISQTSGVIQRYENQVVPVTYIACQVGVISNKILTIDIYDSEGRGDPMIVDSLYLSAECYDVMVEFAYENDETLLHFGNVKVNSTVVRDMYLFNRGKYNIYYKLKKVKNYPEPSLLKSFEVSPECGVLPPTTKLVTTEFECTPTTSLNLVNVPTYTCTLLDGNKNQMIVAKFPVCVTIASFYNTFTLFPLGELNFHVQPVGAGVVREVILNNTSKCPFTYEIILPAAYKLDAAALPSPKVKDNKIKNPPLKCGNFVIMNEDNLLAPATSRTIQIQFLASAAKKFEEVIHFVVSDTCPAEANGVPLKLVGTGALPTLDFWNLETTFREHLIVQSVTEYKVPDVRRKHSLNTFVNHLVLDKL